MKARFGRDYRVTLDESAEGGKDTWMYQVPGRFGTIYPHGGDLLAVECDYHDRTARSLAALPGVTLHQDGNREKTFLFAAELFPAVAAIVQPRRRRRLSEQAKQKLVAAGAPNRFRHGVGITSSERQELAPA